MAKVKTKRERIEKKIDAVKMALAKDIARVISERGITQLQAFAVTGEAPSQISLITTGKLRGFSLERLLRSRAMLGAEIDVAVVSSTESDVTSDFR